MSPCRFVFRLPRCLAVVAVGIIGLPAAETSSLTELRIRPSSTDAAITAFDQPHLVWVRDDVGNAASASAPAARGELLLFLPGTSPPPAPGKAPADGGTPGAAAFCRLAAELGYHAIYLRYPNDKSASACARDEDIAEFERFRLALIRGGTSRHLAVSRTDSIEHRLIKLLQHLHRERPHEGWARFLDGADHATPRWAAIAVAGQSQGGGHAVLIGLKHRVARVIATGAPKDYSLRHRRPAAWLSAESATPKARFFTFNHVQDRQAADLAQQLENLRALGLDAFGAPVNVDDALPPFGGSRTLLTDFPGGQKLSSAEAHTAVISPRNAGRFAAVWRHMLAAKTD